MSINEDQRRIAQTKQALRRLAGGGPLKSGQLFDKRDGKYETWINKVLKRLVTLGVIEAHGSGSGRYYQIAATTNQRELRGQANDDEKVSGLIWPHFMDHLDHLFEPEPEPAWKRAPERRRTMEEPVVAPKPSFIERQGLFARVAAPERRRTMEEPVVAPKPSFIERQGLFARVAADRAGLVDEPDEDNTIFDDVRPVQVTGVAAPSGRVWPEVTGEPDEPDEDNTNDPDGPDDDLTLEETTHLLLRLMGAVVEKLDRIERTQAQCLTVLQEFQS